MCRFLAAQQVDEKRLEQLLCDRNEKNIGNNENLFIAAYANYNDSGKRLLLAFLNQQINRGNDLYATARSLAWKGIVVCRPPFNNLTEGHRIMQQAIGKAVESGDEYLMTQCFELYAFNSMGIGKLETALFYFLKASELRQKLGDACFREKNVGIFGTIGDLLYQSQEYEQAIHYLHRTIQLPNDDRSLQMTHLNTLGLAYQRSAKYDSSLYWYRRSMKLAAELNDSVWQGIISGNIGSFYFDKGDDALALPLLWKDYHATLQKEPNNAGNTLHRIALIYLRQQKMDSALLLARKAMAIVGSVRPANGWFLLNAYKALGDVYRKTGPADSAFYYLDRYQYQKDSLSRWLHNNRSDLAQTRLQFEKTSSYIAALLSEKQAERNRRNLLAAGLLLLLVAGWLYIRWQRQRYKNKQLALQYQKEKAEAEKNNAIQHLQTFTQNIIGKNELIENLQQRLQQHNQQVNEELQHQTILTENDWLRFKDMFDRANPGFLQGLQQKAPDITAAELRLAALMRLNLGNKHIASMLGIRIEAVRKTKSRLRQRLGITADYDLDDHIRQIPVSGPSQLTN